MLHACIELNSYQLLLTIIQDDASIILREERIFRFPNQRLRLLSTQELGSILVFCKELLELARLHKVESWNVHGIAPHRTDSLLNINHLFQQISDELNIEFQVITPEEQVIYTWFGQTSALNLDSTSIATINLHFDGFECIFGENNQIKYSTEIHCNLFQLNQLCFGRDFDHYSSKGIIEMKQEIETSVLLLKWPKRPRQLLFQGELLDYLAMLDLGKFNVTPPNPLQFDQKKLRNWQDFLLKSTRNERHEISDDIQYPNIFLPILFAVEALCSRSYHDSGIVTIGDLSYGLLIAQLKS